jgi:DNA helicase-2/ATP-dependent DNA helicase PcrA
MGREGMIETVRARIFSSRNLAKTCLNKQCNSVCQDYGKCCVTEKSEKQLEYILSSRLKDIFLRACPGSGKTEVVGLKSTCEFDLWTDKYRGIAILTFTNNAAQVIQKRVQYYAGVEKSGYPHFIGTIDSWLHGYLAHPFAHLITDYKGRENDKSLRIVDENISEGWINNYKCPTSYSYFRGNDKTRPGSMPLYANMIRSNIDGVRWEIKIPNSREYLLDEVYFNAEAFKQFRADKTWLTLGQMRKGFLDIKKRFLADGFATYQDIEWICYKLLKEWDDILNRLSQRFPFIIVDECQDLSEIQLGILGFLKQKGTIFHFVGDLNQAIYEFKKVNPQQVLDFVSRNNFEQPELRDNFRSYQSIVDLCQKLVGGSQVAGRKIPDKNGPACVCFFYKNKESISNIPKAFEKYLADRSIEISKSVVLARGWSTVRALKAVNDEQGNQNQLAMAICLWNKKNQQFMDDAILALGYFVANKFFKDKHLNSRRYYCPDSVESPLRWRLFLSRVLDECSKSNCEICDLSQTWDGWVKCVRKNFGGIIASCVKVLDQDLDSMASFTLDGRNFRVPSNLGGQQVILSLTIRDQEVPYIKIKTIHSVKGETFDAILLVSSFDKRGSKGGHWLEWLSDDKDENARFSYVASSRPRKLLAWALPDTKSKTDIKKIQELGFSIIDFNPEGF